MTVRKTFQWTVFLVAMIAAGGWYAVRYALEHKDQLVLQGIRQEVTRKVPDWGVEIADADFNMDGRVWLTDIVIAPDPTQPPLVKIPRCLVTIDPDLLLEHQQLVVRSVQVIQPQVVVSRADDGTWNWQGLSQPAQSDQTPEVFVDDGELLVKLQAADGVPQTEVASRNVDLRLVPDGHKRYLVEGASQIDGAGALAFGGEIDLNSGAWRLIGEALEVDMSQGLLEKAAALAPELGQRVAELSGTPGETTITPGATGQPEPLQGQQPVQTASFEQSAVAPQLSLPNLGLSANIGMAFDLSSDGSQQVPDYRVWAKVVSGTVMEPLSPVPLSNLQGELLIDNGELFIQEFSASNGESRLSLSGQLQEVDGQMVRDFYVSASNLLIDNELRYFLPPAGQRLFDLVQPAGLFTVRGRFYSEGAGTPKIDLDEFQALNCSMNHRLFPYPVTEIQGTVKQTDETLILDLNGRASGRPVQIAGTVQNPGPEAETRIEVRVNELPLDERFVHSLVGPKQQPARRSLEAMQLTGLMDVNALFVRQAGPNQPVVMGLDVDLTQGTMNYERFPYVLSDFSGHVRFNPWQEPVWHFTELSGLHGPAKLTGAGTFDLAQPDGGLLDLHVDAQRVAFDRDLLTATTTAVPELHEAWVQLNPDGGSVDCDDVHLTWTPGRSPQIELPSIRVAGASVTLASFPFRWDNVSAALKWDNDRVTIHQLSARHRETVLEIEGRPELGMAYFQQFRPQDQPARWQLHLDDVIVRNLNPEGEFRNALPGDVAAVLADLNPQGPIDARVSST